MIVRESVFVSPCAHERLCWSMSVFPCGCLCLHLYASLNAQFASVNVSSTYCAFSRSFISKSCLCLVMRRPLASRDDPWRHESTSNVETILTGPRSPAVVMRPYGSLYEVSPDDMSWLLVS